MYRVAPQLAQSVRRRRAAMTDPVKQSVPVHRWYSRPVLFVSDLDRALHFYVDGLGFKKDWHAGDGQGTVCQVSRSECEIILCLDANRRDKARLFIELTTEGLDAFRRELGERSIPNTATWWGYDTTQVNDPDGNELFFPVPD